MAEAFVIRNQLGQYLTKKGEWVSGKEPALVFHQPHYDQALNQLIEVNSKDIDLRGTVQSLELNDKRVPVITELGPDPVQPELLPEDSEEADIASQSEEKNQGEEAA